MGNYQPGDYDLLTSMKETEEQLTEELHNILSHNDAELYEDIKDEHDMNRYKEIYRNREQLYDFKKRYQTLFNEYNKFYNQQIA